MALFMDVHNIEGGVSVEDVAGAHAADLETQKTYGVSLSAGLGERGRGEDLLPR
jgi:hypothetical protein